MKQRKSPRVLLVMHNVPGESTFLAAKFIRLLKEIDVHLLVWDSEARVRKFIVQHHLHEYEDRIHIGITNPAQALKNSLTFLSLLLANKSVRKFASARKANIIFKYLPVFKLKPDIIHFEFGTLATDISAIKHLTATKTIVSFRGYDLNFIGLNNLNYYDDVWKTADAFHFLGNDLRHRAISRGYKEDKLEAIISPAVDTTLFYPRDNNKQNEKLRIVSTGRLTWKKGYEYAIQAMAFLKSKGLPFEYHIIGEGQHRQAIEYAIYENGLQGEVFLPGNKTQEEIRDMLHAADVFLHPAISEGFSNAVMEAQACGLPVICTDADGLAENIENNVTGFIVPKWDAQAIAEKIEWCMANQTALPGIGSKGVARVHKLFKIEDQVKSFVDFYNRVHER